MTSFEKYTESQDQDEIMPQYVVDCDGNLHDLSGNIETKLDSVDKNRRFWEKRLLADENDKQAKKFFSKFNHLYIQICIFKENSTIVAHK